MKNLEDFKNFLVGIDLYTRENIEIGIAFRPSMDLEKVYPFISLVDFIQCMEIGRAHV